MFHGQADGHYDQQTKAAVERFERKHRFKVVDGVVGNDIWHRLHLGAAHEGYVGTVTVPPQPGTPGTTDTFRTVTLNVKSNSVMSQAAVEHDLKRAATEGSVIGWNEISPDRYFKAIGDLGPDWGHYMPHGGKLKSPNPISWMKSEWKLKGEGLERTPRQGQGLAQPLHHLGEVEKYPDGQDDRPHEYASRQWQLQREEVHDRLAARCGTSTWR